jgi:hypothetical protein
LLDALEIHESQRILAKAFGEWQLLSVVEAKRRKKFEQEGEGHDSIRRIVCDNNVLSKKQIASILKFLENFKFNFS